MKYRRHRQQLKAEAVLSILALYVILAILYAIS